MGKRERVLQLHECLKKKSSEGGGGKERLGPA